MKADRVETVEGPRAVTVSLDEVEIRHLLAAEMLKHGGTAPKDCGVADKLRAALEAAPFDEEVEAVAREMREYTDRVYTDRVRLAERPSQRTLNAWADRLDAARKGEGNE